MGPTVERLFFALIRTAICKTPLSPEEKESLSEDLSSRILRLAEQHDLTHLIVFALKQNGCLSEKDAPMEQQVLKAVFRCERLQFALERLSEALEMEKIPHLPLKGSVLRAHYPEPWMRTSGDVDVLVPREEFERASAVLIKKLQYQKQGASTHDASFACPQGIHVELHFDLLEENRANDAAGLLSSVWENAHPCQNHSYRYEMSDPFFYFYHVAHMAKHLEDGGCGIRPFLDLYLLDRLPEKEEAGRDALLSQGKLLRFATVSRTLSRIWMENAPLDPLSLQLQSFVLHGGVYGSTGNRVVIQQANKGGRLGYFLSRVFLPLKRLQRYYPILKKHPWLMPAMQVRRWLMLLNPSVAKMAQSEISVNGRVSKKEATQMGAFLEEIGLSLSKSPKNEKRESSYEGNPF